MPRKLFTIITGDVHHSVLASTYTQAITWAEANLPAIGTSTLLTVTVTPDLVDLTTDKPAPAPAAERSTGAPANTPPRRMTQPGAAKRAKPEEAGGVPAGMVLVKDLAVELGLTPGGMRYRLDRLGVPIVRLDLHGRPGAVMNEAARAAMAGEQEEPAQQPKKEAKARPQASATASARRGEMAKPAGGRMLLVEKAAIELGLTDAQVREIQRSGNIKGGNGWVDVDGLRSYMESDEYEPPFTSN